MFKNHWITVVCIVLIDVMLFVHQTEAECCKTDLFVRHNCINYWCYSYICPDGTLLYRRNHCGVGACNFFGCNCDGGCRRNSKGFDKEEAQRLFLERYKGHILYLIPR